MLLLAAVGSVFTCCVAEVPVVEISSGLVSGKRILVRDELVDAFYGIPYAEPPVGELRFRRPRPVSPWTGVRNATKKPIPCSQLDLRFLKGITLHYNGSSEDCLYLNIWRPAIPRSKERRRDAKLPVIVFVHGGAFQWGDSALPIYDMQKFVSRSDVIFVTFNYRLGVFGFLATRTTDAPGNYGLWDQHMLLTWVRENIGSFGGDAKDVTLVGQSAGGISVGFHAVSPHSRGLFKRAVMQSGTPFSSILWRGQSAVGKMRSIARPLGCYDSEKSVDVVACLRKLDAKAILSAVEKQGPAGQLFFPVIGDSFMPADPQAAATWAGMDIESLLLGTTPNEGTLFVDSLLYSSPKLDAVFEHDYRLAVMAFMATTLGIPIKDARKIVARYYGDYDVEHDKEAAYAIFARVISDGVFHCPTHFFASIASNTGVPTFRYVFDHRASFSFWPESFGVTHADDIFFFYGTAGLSNEEGEHTNSVLDEDGMKRLAGISFSEEEEGFAEELIDSLYEFTKSG
ncbi:hypothetical protein HPB48_012662 [Haemaphysalis longicornis]|uniref:Carboxylic ester hydrolase n=1 Tax=Haemaphysalis longicornis TaxID=44386 RepID=A0A9J6G1N1_HAELO|nr:hypothetical protein HPB48_012662 [Haemaphysalis longicornis]